MIATDTLKLNIGCGEFRMRPPGWINIDNDPLSRADWEIEVPPLPCQDGAVSEIYAGHFLEHLERPRATEFLDECYRVLQPGGTLGIMVPDTREIMSRYIHDEPAPIEFPAGVYHELRDLDECCEVILYSTIQPSHHQWAYDKFTLGRALRRAGFVEVREFDRYHDPRVAVGAWYQFGLECNKP